MAGRPTPAPPPRAVAGRRKVAPDSVSARAVIPTLANASSTRSRRSAAARPRYVNGNSTFCQTVRSPIRLKALKDESDLAIAQARAFAWSRCSTGSPRNSYLPLVGESRRPEDGEQGGLAATRRPRNGHVVAVANFQMNSGERVRLQLVGQGRLCRCLPIESRGWDFA